RMMGMQGGWRPGLPLGPLALPPVSREQIAEYAEAAGDPNPIHWDDAAARAAGLDGVVVHGMWTMAQLGRLLTEAFGSNGRLRRFAVRFVDVVRPGDMLVCTGVVTHVQASSGEVRVACDVWADVAVLGSGPSTRRVVQGEAEFVVPDTPVQTRQTRQSWTQSVTELGKGGWECRG
ncbi:MAG: MaoC family dehydratase N-terminal domain-containing protein, partial [Alicyclobacillus sp.]|nr:MaoC family dehydratase N-terminal domain-containing protein [Alicyclobacillus sp.]